MKLSDEVRFLLKGGKVEDLKIRKDGKYSKSVMKFLIENSIPY